MMLYLLDANVLIDANRDYYPIERVPEFWDWLEHNGHSGNVKLPLEIYDEIKGGNDSLALWVRSQEIKKALLLESEPDPKLVDQAVKNGYGTNLTDDEILKLGRDPFLLAYALTDSSNHTIVTTEVSKPSRTRANRHLPDSAALLGIRTLTTFQFLRELDFKTNWR